jgi:hypothetical protein
MRRIAQFFKVSENLFLEAMKEESLSIRGGYQRYV